MRALLPWSRSEVEELRTAVKQALSELAQDQQVVVVYKPVINIKITANTNSARGGGATITVVSK